MLILSMQGAISPRRSRCNTFSMRVDLFLSTWDSYTLPGADDRRGLVMCARDTVLSLTAGRLISGTGSVLFGLFLNKMLVD